MMQLSIKHITTIIILVFCFSSCNKYLDKKSNTSLIVPETLEDLQALLDRGENMNYATSIYGEASSDDYFVTDEVYNAQYFYDRGAYTWTKFDYIYSNDWSIAYTPVYISNLCLERIDKIDITSQNEGKWKSIKGSCLFFRAYYFLNLAWTFTKAYDTKTFQTDPGIPLRLSSDVNKPSDRTNVKETYERIIADAMEAASYLPNLPQHPMRPSKGAAYGLLARSYLSMREYDSAFKYAGLSLSIKNTLLDYNDPEDVDPASFTPFQPFNRETIFYSNSNTSFLAIPYNYNALADTLLYDSYVDDDLRKSAYFMPSGDYQSFKGNQTSDGELFTGIATNEMYLTRAECYARAGNKDGALKDLNALLAKRWATGTFIPFTASTADEALNLVLTERRKELLFRGLRWIDIKRLNKEGAGIVPKRIISGQTYTLDINSGKYALPLPKDIVDQGLPQNSN